MISSFLLTPKAQKELLDAWEWYENQQQGLGDRFKNEILKKLSSILNNPQFYPQKGRYLEARPDVFPYLIIYKTDKINDLILVVSVFHMKRHPKNK